VTAGSVAAAAAAAAGGGVNAGHLLPALINLHQGYRTSVVLTLNLAQTLTFT